VFPARKSFIPQFVTINSNGLINILYDDIPKIFNMTASAMTNNLQANKEHLWDTIFKTKDRAIFHRKKFSFFHLIKTDGVTASIVFINTNEKKKKHFDHIPEDKYDSNYVVNSVRKVETLEEEEVFKFNVLLLSYKIENSLFEYEYNWLGSRSC
jgi:hypothetical protein